MSIAFYEQLLKVLHSGAVVLATVVQSRGSVPREVGAKMIVCADGSILSTIGGGAGEAKVIRQAMQVLATGEKQWVEIDLSGAPQRETQGICGGTMRIWLEPWQGESAITLTEQILAKLQSGQPVTLTTPFAPDQSPYLAEPLESEKVTASELVEIIQPPPTLLIVGAGHVGEQLAKVADLIGFQVAVQDDRPEWANPQRYPQAQIFTAPIAETVSQFASHTQLYAALVTRGYQYDLEALMQLITRPIPCVYIGMIGSRKRVRQVQQALLNQGIPDTKIYSLYAPIGLEIGALTPEEIAVSISAELIRVRRGGSGRSLSELDKSQ
jgi:xanthine dehydrogenase accessory factor